MRLHYLVLFAAATAAQGQLAITEVMSNGSTNLGSSYVTQKPDFWELTNFGTNAISLSGYSFTDDSSNPMSDLFAGRVINPGESIIFLRTNASSMPQDFINWWGAGNLPPNLQVGFYRDPGFSSERDFVRLFNPNGILVDRVDFGRALRGHTFVYVPETGEFGSYSTLDLEDPVNRSFKAVLTDDIGSPGVTTGPVPMSILEQPESTTQDAGLDVEFTVRAAGFPRPSFQWLWNGTVLPGARSSKLILNNVQPQNAGSYAVRIANGQLSVTSAPAILQVNITPTPATILVAPADAIVFEGQTAVFTVRARGFPPPGFQWQTNGVDIPGATQSTLLVAGAILEMSGTLVSVRVQNANGSTNAGARLTVTRRPLLRITEVMNAVSNGAASGHSDWFELTNLDTNAVNLLGFRFTDGDRYSFAQALRITNSLIIEPGESVVFVERMIPDQFIAWWGRDRLPPGLKVITYSGFGLDSDGDEIYFWNGAETDLSDPIISAGFVRAEPGISQQYSAPEYFFPVDSRSMEDGAFPAVNGGDIGSPGYLTNPPPRFISVMRNQSGMYSKCRVTPGKRYDLRFKAHFSDLDEVTLQTYLAEDFVITIPLPSDDDTERFFRMEEIP